LKERAAGQPVQAERGGRGLSPFISIYYRNFQRLFHYIYAPAVKSLCACCERFQRLLRRVQAPYAEVREHAYSKKRPALLRAGLRRDTIPVTILLRILTDHQYLVKDSFSEFSAVTVDHAYMILTRRQRIGNDKGMKRGSCFSYLFHLYPPVA
jgi:hypothetical protein